MARLVDIKGHGSLDAVPRVVRATAQISLALLCTAFSARVTGPAPSPGCGVAIGASSGSRSASTRARLSPSRGSAWRCSTRPRIAPWSSSAGAGLCLFIIAAAVSSLDAPAAGLGPRVAAAHHRDIRHLAHLLGR
jgi:hypothetical protein